MDVPLPYHPYLITITIKKFYLIHVITKRKEKKRKINGMFSLSLYLSSTPVSSERRFYPPFSLTSHLICLIPATIASQSLSPPCSLTLTVGNILDTIQPLVTQSFRRKSNIFVEGEVYLKFFIPFCVETLYLGFVYYEVCSQKMGKYFG